MLLEKGIAKMDSQQPINSSERMLQEMRNVIEGAGVCTVEPCGCFVLRNEKPKKIVPKSVYGFAIELSENEKSCLFNYATEQNHCKLEESNGFQPIFDNVYPLYWGKDKSIGHRIYQHVQDECFYGGTGSIRLLTYSLLQGKEIFCALAVVNNAKCAEQALRRAHPDLLKTWTIKKK